MVFCVFLAAVLAVLLIFCRKYEADFVREHQKEIARPSWIASCGLCIAAFVSKYRKESPAEIMMQKALLKSAAELKTEQARTYGTVWCVLFAGAMVGILIAVLNGPVQPLTELKRPVFGEKQVTDVVVHGLSKEEKLAVQVSGKDPDAEEAEAVFQAVIEEMEPVWLNGNRSMQEIRTPMSFPDESEDGVVLTYRSRTPEVLSNFGMIVQEAEEIPDAGLPCEVEVTLSYKELRYTHHLKLLILPPEEKVLSETERLQQLIEEADAKQAAADSLVLPGQIDGRTVTYEAERTSPYLGLLFAAILGVCVILLPGEKQKEAYRKRNLSLRLSYPNILSKMSTLIHAGMSIRNAWIRVAEEYRQALESGVRSREYAYEEMVITALQMKSGKTETEAYAEFGRRAGMHCYVKFANLLSENVRQGISGLEKTLSEEMSAALEERKNAALKRGEEAGTRLLFPMIIMLGIVMVVLAVPAFLSL